MLEGKFPLDHVGIAVADLETEIARYQSGFALTVAFRETVASQKTEIAFLNLGNTKLELLAPVKGEGPIAKFLEKRGPGLHHICFKVDDIKAELARLSKHGYQLIDSEPRSGAENTLIAFIHPKSTGGVLLELCQHR